MADGSSDAVEDTTLEGSAAEWLAQRADDLDVSPDELLERVVAAYRAAEADDATGDVVTTADLDERLAALEADVDDDLDDVEEEFAAKIQDVRERVVQVKRETDAKAATDHDHPALADRTVEAVETAHDVERDVAEVVDTVRGLSERLDAGFENYEAVLTYLRDETDELDRKLTTLATAVLSMRESVASLAAANARRERTDRLKRAANRANVRVADCEGCGTEVTVSLLTAPKCPSCEATFEDVDANPGWFGTHELVTGSAPALTSGESGVDEDDEAWLGADTATLEAMASGDDADGGDASDRDDDAAGHGDGPFDLDADTLDLDESPDEGSDVLAADPMDAVAETSRDEGGGDEDATGPENATDSETEGATGPEKTTANGTEDATENRDRTESGDVIDAGSGETNA